ncbi:hypothetical protein PanWU01x14_306290 [Parasponia andersonii]|uniref:Uncharacterized protein n=1 Tax=Parasponia andersonii TaxID=3476 RepID=A0A2P5ARQ6_PARAD|nr:hypothetical protein PanWU01x14_306290 [Parasponia andersonii]
MKVILSIKNHSLGFYFGFYSPEINSDRYLLSVVAVGAVNISHIVVWKDSYFVPENSTLELSGAGSVAESQLAGSFEDPVDTLLVGQRLYEVQMLTYFPSTAGLTEGATFSVYTNPSDGGHLIYSQLQLERNSSD